MRPPKLEDIIGETIDARLEDVHTAEVGWVMEYSADSGTCTAQPSIAQAYVDEKGERRLSAKPPCRAARVAFPGNIVFQLLPGDPVLIVCCSSALDNWSAGRNRVVDPGDDRRHNLSDAFIIPLGKPVLPGGETPARDEVIVGYDKVKLGSRDLGESRHQVIRKIDAQAGKTAIDAEVSATQTALDAAILGLPGTAAVVAKLTAKLESLTSVAGAFTAMVNSINSNVEAT